MAQLRELWSGQELMKVARRQRTLFWLVLMNFMVAFICLGPILAGAWRAMETSLTAEATGAAASASQPTSQTNSPPASAEAASPSAWDNISRSMARGGAAATRPLADLFSSVPWGYAIPIAIILASLVTVYCNQRLAAALRAPAAWYYINPLLMITAGVIVGIYQSQILDAFAAREPWSYVALSLLSLLSLGALFPVVRLDSAATSLLDRHGIAFGSLGAKMDSFEPRDIRRFRCPKCQVVLLPEQEFWDGANAKCIYCGTVMERLPSAEGVSPNGAAVPGR